MNNKNRGYALIFNHEDYHPEADEDQGLPLGKRIGTQNDCDRLKNCLSDLGFKVRVFQDLPKSDVHKTLEKCKCLFVV